MTTDTALMPLRPSEKILIKYSHSMRQRIDKLAHHEGRTVSELIREATRRYLDAANVDYDTLELPKHIKIVVDRNGRERRVFAGMKGRQPVLTLPQ